MFDQLIRMLKAPQPQRLPDLRLSVAVLLLEAGEVRAAQMVQLHGHTSEVFDQMAPEERIGLVEMLWEVAYADGVLDPEEDLLIRRVAGLIHVTDRERILARQQVLARLGRTL